jgi:hypothetical protein
VLDEPFAALDTGSRSTAATLIERAAVNGCAVLLSDHTDTRLTGSTLRMLDGELTVERSGRSDRWRVTVSDADGVPSVVIVTPQERDRLLLDVLSTGGHVLGVEEVR